MVKISFALSFLQIVVRSCKNIEVGIVGHRLTNIAVEKYSSFLAFDNTYAVPMVLDLHGYTTSANGQSHQSGWKHLGQTEELIVVWPEGMSDSNNSLYAWNCSTNVGGPLGPTCDIGK